MKLTSNENKILNAFNRENKVISMKNVIEDDSITNIPTVEEYQKIEKLKYDREMAKYDDGLSKIKKSAKSIQNSALRIKTNNRIIHSRLLDIQETDRLIQKKNDSIEDTLYRLLVRLE